MHDHPWQWGIALPLIGGYEEARLSGFDMNGARIVVRRRRPGLPYRLSGEDFHRVILRGPTSWSLFIHGPLTKGWGFLRPAGKGTVRFDAPQDWDMDELKFWASAPRGRDVPRAGP